MNDMLDNYRNLVSRIDALCRIIHETLKEQITCSEGCSTCCTSFSIFPVEAAALNAALNDLPYEDSAAIRRHVVEHAGEDRCPLLADNSCILYAARPIICRTHGLPIVYTENQQRQVDSCPLNLQEFGTLPGSAVIDLDRLNPMLVAVNALFLSKACVPDTLTERLTIAEALIGDTLRIHAQNYTEEE